MARSLYSDGLREEQRERSVIKWPALTADLWLGGSVLCSVQQLWHGPLELRQIIMIAGSLQSSDQNQVKLCRKTNTQQQKQKKAEASFRGKFLYVLRLCKVDYASRFDCFFLLEL